MAGKISYLELHQKIVKACKLLKPITFWRHYKNGHVYRVVSLTISEATQEVMVVYSCTSAPGTFGVHFTRPLSEWEELVVDKEGIQCPRFTPYTPLH